MGKKTHFSHPGQILKREWLDELGILPGTLARHIGVDRTRIKAIIDGDRDITADTAMRLAKFLGTTPDLWLNLQAHYDLAVAQAETGRDIDWIKPYQALGAWQSA